MSLCKLRVFLWWRYNQTISAFPMRELACKLLLSIHSLCLWVSLYPLLIGRLIYMSFRCKCCGINMEKEAKESKEPRLVVSSMDQRVKRKVDLQGKGYLNWVSCERLLGGARVGDFKPQNSKVKTFLFNHIWNYCQIV